MPHLDHSGGTGTGAGRVRVRPRGARRVDGERARARRRAADRRDPTPRFPTTVSPVTVAFPTTTRRCCRTAAPGARRHSRTCPARRPLHRRCPPPGQHRRPGTGRSLAARPMTATGTHPSLATTPTHTGGGAGPEPVGGAAGRTRVPAARRGRRGPSRRPPAAQTLSRVNCRSGAVSSGSGGTVTGCGSAARRSSWRAGVCT